MGNLAMNVSAAADALGVSTTAIRRWVKSGELPSVRLGGRVLITHEALRKLLKLDPDLVDSETPSGQASSERPNTA